MPTPGPKDLTVNIYACALNHRDLFIRQHLYPGIDFSVPLLTDGYGVVTACGPECDQSWLNKKVILTPGRGWKDSPDGPDGIYQILGGTKYLPVGTASDVVCVDESEVELAPTHLNAAEAAALPLTGLTAWRAFVTKCGDNVQEGRNILVTGIGGGVALNALQFAVAKGCKVWVTSGSEEKIKKAKKMGAVGGVNYRTEGWEKELVKMLPKDRPFIDAVVDGAGGDVIAKAVKIMKNGGVVAQYGMTVSPKMDWIMAAVMKNIDLKGSTMGSRVEFAAMIEFVREKKIKPIVSRVVKGFENLKEVEELFDEMKKGSQFGKLVIEVVPEGNTPSKL